MTRGEQVFRDLQRAARAALAGGQKTSTQEYVTRHALESFVDRLSRTAHAESFVLKGGLLLSAYDARRSTRDFDVNARSIDISEESLQDVVSDVAALDADDGIELESPANIDAIRDGNNYPAFRVRLGAKLGPTAVAMVAWDVSTGDPIYPAPRIVELPRLVGPPIRMLGYPKETVIAEKAVTILERGATSTRWRDYVDIMSLVSGGFDADELLTSARYVAKYRDVALRPTADLLAQYGDEMQQKWAAWRRIQGLEAVCSESLLEQVADVARVIDPIFTLGSGDASAPELSTAGDHSSPQSLVLPASSRVPGELCGAYISRSRSTCALLVGHPGWPTKGHRAVA